MATNQAMREAIYEGILYIFLRANEAMSVCDVVTLDSSNPGEVKLCADTDYPFGLVAEQVTANGVADYEPGGLVSHTAKVGDLVGVYICGGVYNAVTTDTLAFGDLLYVDGGTDGMLCNTEGSAVAPVGLCVQATDADGYFKVKSFL